MTKFFAALLCIGLGAAAALYTYPRWGPALEQAVPQSAQYLPALPSSPASTVPPVQISLSPSPTAVALPDSSSAVIPPTPPTTGVGGGHAPATSPWSAADCRFVLLSMGDDSNDDTAEAAAIRSGADTRFPLSDAAYYTTIGLRWGEVVTQAQDICAQVPPVTGPTVLPTSAQVQTAIQWFTVAEAGHRAWEAAHGTDSWDDAWLAIYARMTTLYGELP